MKVAPIPECVICYEGIPSRKLQTRCKTCDHVVCKSCTRQMEGSRCPMCRAEGFICVEIISPTPEPVAVVVRHRPSRFSTFLHTLDSNWERCVTCYVVWCIIMGVAYVFGLGITSLLGIQTIIPVNFVIGLVSMGVLFCCFVSCVACEDSIKNKITNYLNRV